jgi:sulfonate transport system ATP-binding protein
MQTSQIEQARVEARAAVSAKRGIRVAVRSVTKSYSGREVLKAVELTIAPGEFVAVVGRSGCGKSTLLRLIAELEPFDSGNIAFGEHGHRPETRIMFQDSRLLPWKRVLDNVALGLPQVGAAALNALRQVGLEERADEWPAVLSGGQRQRVALARALVHDPQLLLLDEPLGALDALTRIEMQQLIESLWQQRGFSALLVTHDVQEAIALADRVVLIEDGRITLDERIGLARPRARGNAAFALLEERILARVLKHPPSGPDTPLGDVSLQRTVSQVMWAI